MVFALGGGVGDDAAAGLDEGFAVLEQNGAEGDAGVVVAVEAEVAYGPRVGAAFAFFEFVQDLHGADLGGAGDGSSGECGAHDIEGAAASGEFAGDMGDDVHDMAVTLDCHEVGDFHRAVFRDAADIVAGEVDEHEVLSALLRIGHEIGGVGIILLDRCSTAAGAGDGADFHEVAGEAHMDLGRTAHEGVSTGTAQAEHVGRGIHKTQGAVEIEGVVVEFGFEALGEHDLEDIPRADVFVRAVDHGVVFFTGRIRSGWRGGGGGFREDRLEGEGLGERLQNAANPLAGGFVGGGGIFFFGKGIRDNPNSALAVIEGHNDLCDHEKHVRNSEFILWRGGDGGLEPADAIVAQVADGAAVEKWQRGLKLCAVGCHPHFEFIERVAVGLEGARGVALGEREGFSCSAEGRPRPESQKGKAAGLVFLLGGFEEKGWRLTAQLGEGGDRRVAIRHDLAHDGHDSVGGRFFQKSGARRGDRHHVNETFGASRSAGFSTWNNSAAAKLKMPAMMFVGKSSRFVL